MTTPVWPDELPACVLPRSIATTEPDGRLRTATDSGPGKTRLANTAAMMPASLEFVLSPAQVARLMRFWREDTAGGTLPFVIRDPWLHGRGLTQESGLILTDGNGAALVNTAHWLAEFDAPPGIPRQSRRHARVSVGLRVYPG